MAHSIEIRQGETSPWEFTLKDKDGAVSLAGRDSIKLYLKDPSAEGNIVDGEDVNVVDEDAGECSYSPKAADVGTVRTLRGHVTVVRTAGGVEEKYPQKHDMEVIIRASLDN